MNLGTIPLPRYGIFKDERALFKYLNVPIKTREGRLKPGDLKKHSNGVCNNGFDLEDWLWSDEDNGFILIKC